MLGNVLNVLKGNMPPGLREDADIIYGGSSPQHVVFTDIPYLDHNNNRKIIVSAVYNMVHKTLPSILPTLLPPLQFPPAYEVRNVPGKGKGIIATRNIAFGEIVIMERPILIFPRLMLDINSVLGFQAHAKQSMTREDWIKFNDLANVQGNFPTFDGIRFTNTFGIQLQKGKEKYSGVFFELSRLNHSCGPNLKGTWNPHLFTFSVQAARPIFAGQELTLSYTDIFLPYAERQSALQQDYKFSCNCTYCKTSSVSSLSAAASDQRRQSLRPDNISHDFELVYNYVTRPELESPRPLGRHEAHMMFNDLIGILATITKEGLESIAAPVVYTFLMELSGLLGDKTKFRKWGFKAIMSSVIYIEGDEKVRRDVAQWIDWMRNPKKKFPEWGRCQ